MNLVSGYKTSLLNLVFTGSIICGSIKLSYTNSPALKVPRTAYPEASTTHPGAPAATNIIGIATAATSPVTLYAVRANDVSPFLYSVISLISVVFSFNKNSPNCCPYVCDYGPALQKAVELTQPIDSKTER
jgi:hypothetical protein